MTTSLMRVNPQTREIFGQGVNGSGHHVFTCLSCPDGEVAYAPNGKRRDHIRKTQPAAPRRHAFEISTYCPGGGPVRGEVVESDDYNTAYATAVATALA